MVAYEISKIIAKKKKYIFLILIAVFILISVATTVVGSFSLFQYDTAKKNFSDNQFAKSIEITSYSPRSNETRKLNLEDIDYINGILQMTEMRCKLVIGYLIHFGIPTETGEIVFVKSFSDDFFTEEDLNDENALITKNPALQGKLQLSIPVISTEGGGYISDRSITKEYECLFIEDNSVLSGYIKEDELIASEKAFADIVGIMFSGIDYSDVENIYVTVDSIDDVKRIANVLTSEKYDVKHAFEYYDDLDVSIGRLINLSLLVLVFLLILSMFLLIGMFELTLKNAVGDIAILKHLGFRCGIINRVYLYPMIEKMAGSMLVIFVTNTILYLVRAVNCFVHVLLFTSVAGLLGIVVLTVMLGRVNYYCKKDVLALLEKYKVEE